MPLLLYLLSCVVQLFVSCVLLAADRESKTNLCCASNQIASDLKSDFCRRSALQDLCAHQNPAVRLCTAAGGSCWLRLCENVRELPAC